MTYEHQLAGLVGCWGYGAFKNPILLQCFATIAHDLARDTIGEMSKESLVQQSNRYF